MYSVSTAFWSTLAAWFLFWVSSLSSFGKGFFTFIFWKGLLHVCLLGRASSSSCCFAFLRLSFGKGSFVRFLFWFFYICLLEKASSSGSCFGLRHFRLLKRGFSRSSFAMGFFAFVFWKGRFSRSSFGKGFSAFVFWKWLLWLVLVLGFFTFVFGKGVITPQAENRSLFSHHSFNEEFHSLLLSQGALGLPAPLGFQQPRRVASRTTLPPTHQPRWHQA